MRWFKHDSNAHNDAKLKRVRQKYGMLGYGLYWYCIELIAGKVEKSNIRFELEEDAEIIAIDWNLDHLKVEEIMDYFVDIGLFESNKNVITCLKLAKRLDDTNAKNPQIKQLITDLRDSEIVGVTPSNSDMLEKSPRKSGQTRLDKNRLDKNNKKHTTELPLKDGNEWTIPNGFIKEMSLAYPDVDLFTEAKTMRAWLVANPAKQKTKSQIKKFINSWLSRAKPQEIEDDEFRGAI